MGNFGWKSLQQALKSCPITKKSPNLVTLLEAGVRFTRSKEREEKSMDLRKEKSASFETHLTGQFPDSHFLLRHFSHFQLNSNTKMGTHFINISFLFYFLKNQLCKKYLLPAKGIGSWMALMVIGIEAGYSDDLRLHPTQFCSLFVFQMGQPRPLFR